MASKAKNSSDKNINALSEDAAVFEYNATNNYFDVVSTDDVAILTLEASSGKFKIKNGSYYLTGGYNSGNNYAKYDTSGNDATITYSTDGNGEITLLFDQSVTNGRNVFQYNSASTLFSCYSSASQSPVFLYMEDGSTPAAKAAAPTFSLEDTEALVYGTTYSVSISSGEKDSSFIYYSTDGGANWSYDFTPVTVDVADDKSISAYAVLFDANTLDPIADSKSNTVTKNYIFQACSLTVEPAGGTVPENQPVTITATPDDATITWIYDDGGEGQMDEGTGTQTLTLTADGELTVEVTKDGYKKAEGTYTYTVTHICAEPTFSVSLDEGQGYATVAKGAKVTISSTTQGATIKWRLDEADEWTIGNEVEVTDDCTIYVLVEKEGYTSATGSIVVKVQQLAEPTISPEGQRFDEGTTLKVEITSIEGATIHYTTDDGTTYNEAPSPATLYITTTTTVTAYATHAEWKNSPEATATYTARVPGSSLEFELVTDTKDINENNQYIVVYEETSGTTHTYGAFSKNQLSDVSGVVSLSTENGVNLATIENTEAGVNIFTIEASGNESYPYFIRLSDDQYLAWDSSTSVAEQETGYAHNITLTSTYKVNVIPHGDSGRHISLDTNWKYYSSSSSNTGKLYMRAKPDISASPESGAYPKGTDITFSTRTDGATIYYQIKNAGDTDYSSTIYTKNPMELTEDCTVKAWASTNPDVMGEISYFTYTIAQLDTPVISPETGYQLPDGSTVTITALEGSTIYYSIDNWATTKKVTPEEGSETVATITLNMDDFDDPTQAEIKFKATNPNYVASEESSATYDIYAVKEYQWITTIKEGVDYILAGYNGATAYIFTTEEGTAGASNEKITTKNDQETLLVGNENAGIIRFVKNTSEGAGESTYFMISMNGETTQYIHHSSADNGFDWNTTEDFNTITFDDNNHAKIVGSGGSTLKFNESTIKFNYYSSTGNKNAVPILYIDASALVMDPVFYKSNCQVPLGYNMKVTCATEGASITWTFEDLDGNALDITPWYVDGDGWYFPVNQDMKVTAKATKEGLEDSDLAETTYYTVDLAAEPRYFKRVASMDDIEEGIKEGREFIIGAYSRFFLSQEGSPRPGLMSIAERSQGTDIFKLWAAPRQSTTWGITNFVLVGEEDGLIDDGDDEIQVNNGGIMAMRSADATNDDFEQLAFITIEHYTGTDRTDFDGKTIADDVQLYSFKIGDKYLNATSGSGDSPLNTCYWSDEQVPMMLDMITTDLSEIPEDLDYLSNRFLIQWIKTTDKRKEQYKCLEYNYSGNINVFAGYQHSLSGPEQVYPFIYVEEDYESVKCPEPLYKEYNNKEGNNYTYAIKFNQLSDIPTYIWAYMEGQEKLCTDTPATSDEGNSEAPKRPRAVSYDNDDAVISVTVNLHGKHEGGVHTFTSEVGKPVKIPIYVTSTVKATAAYDGYLASRSDVAVNEVTVDDTTGIVEVGIDEIEQGARVFNLQGQLLPRPVKGQVVIVAPQGGRAYKALLK